MIITFHLLISFFYKFIGADYPVTTEALENFGAVQYYFFTDFLDFNSLYDIQIFLRFSLKMEYLYTDFVLPIELLSLKVRSEKLEEERKNRLEELSKS